MIVKNKHIPVGDFSAMAIWPFIFIRKDKFDEKKSLLSKIKYQKYVNSTIRHERTHFKQQKELLVVFFYFLYVIVMWPIYGYKKIPFEAEAYQNENDIYYLKNRKSFAWIKYI